jgi:murein DD-endopeptidase MepM/ murein hydrolase activator NlpD
MAPPHGGFAVRDTRLRYGIVFARKALVGGLIGAALFPSSAAARIPDFVLLPPKSPPVRFGVPVPGALQSPFGYRWGRLHSGVDLDGETGDPVRAALPGRVTAAGYLNHYSGYGLTVKIRHDDGLATMYAHLSSANVRVGQEVRQGEVVGRVGCTGSCTGSHLHFEVRVRGMLTDPLGFLGKRLSR